MAGPVEGPLPPTSSLASLISEPTSSVSRASILAPKIPKSITPNVADVLMELNSARIPSPMGARLVVAFVELLLYLKGQVPFPPSQLRKMAATGRRGSSHQSKLLKSLNNLTNDMPSTFLSLRTQETVTLAIVFGLGREKCFVQLLGTELAPTKQIEAETTVPGYPLKPCREITSDENLKFNTVPVRRRPSPRPPLQELPTVDTLSSQLASVSLQVSPDETLIRQSERALSQAMACSEVEFNSNLHPMAAQVYLRAPRGFRHQSWSVRPQAARMLDEQFNALVSGESLTVECVRIRAKDAVDLDETEMIWWGWDGKLAGYA
ncbi:hypothetical protein CTheo_8538 [Ceratobasidium theobromae]|uniref:Uncharacterized protein n=1 Tax=Ceratobasidium theobromae TaxID=1582974 RepID=A0A5N5Q9B8_9AGAM|nr:hypothetical protein CTheo_8538 [Ceratobasidium theobromae]